MNKQAVIYDEATISLLSGKIKKSSYMKEVQQELAKKGKRYSDGYVSRVIGRFRYNTDIWDAAQAVVNAREAGAKERDQIRAKLKGTSYTAEIKAELAKNGLSYTPEYISTVITKGPYNVDIWQAAKQVVDNREGRKQANASRVLELAG